MRTSGAGTGAPHATRGRRLVRSPFGVLSPEVRNRARLPHDGPPEARSRPHPARARGPPERRASGRRSPRSSHAWGHRSRALRTVPRELGLGAVAARSVKKGHDWRRTREMTPRRDHRWRGWTRRTVAEQACAGNPGRPPGRAWDCSCGPARVGPKCIL